MKKYGRMKKRIQGVQRWPAVEALGDDRQRRGIGFEVQNLVRHIHDALSSQHVS